MHRRSLLLPLLSGLLFTVGSHAFQRGAASRLAAPVRWTTSEEEHFLATAGIMSEEPIGKGLTKPKKAMLSDGRRTHAAQIQAIDVYMSDFHGTDGSEEQDFKDTWKFNVAAYRLAKLLHLTDMVPTTVERVVDGKPSALTWWVDGVLMDERERVERNVTPPDAARWRDQMDTIRTFDQLIYNMDRNRENLLITNDWQVWMIDHTRAFRKWTTLRNSAAITTCNPELLRALIALKRTDVERELNPYLSPEEIAGLMTRRDVIVGMLTRHAHPQ